MPECRECGNTLHFSSSKVPPETPYTNPPLPLKGVFDRNGKLDTIESTGIDDAILNSAWDTPETFFNVCGKCGSQNISW